MASRHSFRNGLRDLRSNFMKSDEFGSVWDEGSSRSDEVGSASILIISCRSFSWRSARDMYAFLSVSQVSVSAHDGEDSSSSVSASPRSWYLKICQFSDPTLLTVSRSANMLFVCSLFCLVDHHPAVLTSIHLLAYILSLLFSIFCLCSRSVILKTRRNLKMSSTVVSTPSPFRYFARARATAGTACRTNVTRFKTIPFQTSSAEPILFQEGGLWSNNREMGIIVIQN